MRAIRIHAVGGPEVLQLEDVPVPSPGPGQVLIRVEAAGINFIDIYRRTGLYPARLPLTLGEEAWRASTRKSALRRAKHRGLLRNAIVASGASGDAAKTAIEHESSS